MATTAPLTDVARLAVASPEALAAFCRIDGPRGPERLRLWPGQRAALRFARDHEKAIILKARQLGITWSMALQALHFAMTSPAQTCLILSVGERESAVVLRRIRRLYLSLPTPIRQAFPCVRGLDGGERFEIGHPEGPGTIVSLPGSGGRSETAQLLILDEGAHWEKSEERLAAVLPTAGDVGRIVLFSTANGAHGTFWEMWYGHGRDQWPGLFLDAVQRPDRDMAWVRRERADLGEKGPQEYPMDPTEAFLSSGRCVFDVHALEALRRSFTEPPRGRYDLRHQDGVVVADPDLEGRWMVWEWPKAGRRYIIAADVCGGGGGDDYAYATVHDAESWDQVAALHGRPDPGVLAAEMAKAGWLYAGEGRPALLVPEANNHGQAVVALLSEWGYPRIYTREAFDRRGSAPAPSSLLGWLTTGKSREVAISALQDAIRDEEAGIRDAAAIGECLAFVDKDGRVEAAEGSHDDRVLALAIAYAVLARSRAGRRVEQRPQAPYVPRVSSLTGY